MRSWIFILAIGFGLSLTAQEEDPMKYYDDGGQSNRKNMIFYDFGYLYKPAYVLGYERWISKSSSISAGYVLLSDMEKYTIPFTDFEIPYTYRKSKSPLNFVTEFKYYFSCDDKKLNSLSFGYNMVHYDSACTHDLCMSKTLFSYQYKTRLAFSIAFQAGFRFIKVNNYGYINPWTEFDEKQSKTVMTFFIHAPIKLFYRF